MSLSDCCRLVWPIQSPISMCTKNLCYICLTAFSCRYRAIMGPFHWTVWLALTLTYLLAIFPIAFSYSHSLTHLLKDPWQVENMFWYVFGTFTNCFTFKGNRSWSNSDKAATRMLIGEWIREKHIGPNCFKQTSTSSKNVTFRKTFNSLLFIFFVCLIDNLINDFIRTTFHAQTTPWDDTGQQIFWSTRKNICFWYIFGHWIQICFQNFSITYTFHSRLKGWNVLRQDTKVCFYCERHEEFKDFFLREDGVVFYNDVCSVMEVLGHE